jgi:phosphatidylglycerophosphatase A
MRLIAKLFATCIGIGYLQKGSGTVAAAAACVVWYIIQMRSIGNGATFALILVLFFAGVWASNIAEDIWGKDNCRIVIDEWVGMFISLFMLPVTYAYLIAAFILFRFFDIVKPLYIRKAERLPAGW